MASVFPICNSVNKNTILTMPLKNGFIFSCQVIKFCTSEPQVSTDHRDQRDREGLPQSTLSLTICTDPDEQSWIAVIGLCPPEGKEKKESLAKLVSERLTHIVHLGKEIGKLLRHSPSPPKKEKSKSYVNSGRIRSVVRSQAFYPHLQAQLTP